MFFDCFKPFYILRLVRGEEIISSLRFFVEKKKIPSGILWGIGAVKNAEIGYFDDKKKEYLKKKFKKSLEILSLSGSISLIENKPYIHLHCVLGDEKLKGFGGHLFSGITSATAEIYIYTLKRKIYRKKDEEEPFFLLHLKKILKKEEL
ncbi:MAG: PPC domain-containing DNA-binding protein [Thermoanaerobaculia bacterium]